MAQITRLFPYTGKSQNWVVPAGVTQATFECYGATGGHGAIWGVAVSRASTQFDVKYWVPNGADITNSVGPGNGSNGAGYVSGTLTVTPGSTYYVYVGGNGGDSAEFYTLNNASTVNGTGGWNGGGAGGKGYAYAPSTVYGSYAIGGGGGGGATDVRSGGAALANRILVAGGAGGEGGNAGDSKNGSFLSGNPTGPLVASANPTTPVPPFVSPFIDGKQYNSGYYVSSGYGHGGYGGPSGASGGNATNTTGSSLGSVSSGDGGTTTGGGAGGTQTQGYGTNGATGALGVGGSGGNASTSSAAYPVPGNGGAPGNGYGFGGGGGGGGYYGGGGGCSGYTWNGAGGGGGGGSNFIGAGFTNTVNTSHAVPSMYYGIDLTRVPADDIAARDRYGAGGGLARITYRQPPVTPTILGVNDGDQVTAGSPLQITWTYAAVIEVAGVQRAGGSLRYSVHNANTWTQIDLATPEADDPYVYTIPGSALVSGNQYDIQVRTFDTDSDVSSWGQVTVKAITPPTPPVITAPAAGSVNNLPFNVSFTNPNTVDTFTGGHHCSFYRVQVTSKDYTLDSGIVRTSNRINFLTNSRMSTVAGWVSPVGSVATSAVADPFGNTGVLAKTTADGSTTAQGWDGLYIPVNVVPGMPYDFSGYFQNPASGGVSTMAIGVWDPATGGWVAQSPTVNAGTAWARLSVGFTATQSLVWFVFLPEGGHAAAGKVVNLSSALAEIGNGTLQYFGGTPGGTGTTGLTHDTSIGTGLTFGYSSTSLPVAYSTTAADPTFTYQVKSGSGGWPATLSDPVTISAQIGTLQTFEALSAPTTRDASININPPGVPTVAVTPQNDYGAVQLTITANDAPNSTAYVDVFRSEVPSNVIGGDPDPATEVLIASGRTFSGTPRTATVFDTTLATDKVYAYRVRAYSQSGGFADKV